MFGWRQGADGASAPSKLATLEQSQAIIEFRLDGTIISAKKNFQNEIDALNDISGDVVRDLGAIRKAIEMVSEYVPSTAAAVEEQNVVTKDISTNMPRAAAELS